MKTKELVEKYYNEGMGCIEISQLLGKNKSTISYHYSKLSNIDENEPKRISFNDIDWTSIQEIYDTNRSIRKTAEHFSIGHATISKALSKGLLKKKSKLNINDDFIENSTCSRKVIKDRILKYNLLEYKCQECGMLPTWNNKKLVLILDHINGINNDHRISNLRFLCPNCNSQTDTFCGKNKKKII